MGYLTSRTLAKFLVVSLIKLSEKKENFEKLESSLRYKVFPTKQLRSRRVSTEILPVLLIDVLFKLYEKTWA